MEGNCRTWHFAPPTFSKKLHPWSQSKEYRVGVEGENMKQKIQSIISKRVTAACALIDINIQAVFTSRAVFVSRVTSSFIKYRGRGCGVLPEIKNSLATILVQKKHVFIDCRNVYAWLNITEMSCSNYYNKSHLRVKLS